MDMANDYKLAEKLVRSIEKACKPIGLAYVGMEIAKKISIKFRVGNESYTNMKDVVVSLYRRDFNKYKDDRQGLIRKFLFLLFHELSHVLFTDSEQGYEVNKKVVKIWEDEAGRLGLTFWKDPAQLAHDLINSVEDGRIENHGIKRDKTFKKYRDWARIDEWNSYEMPENPNPYSLIRNSILDIATTGMYPKGYDTLDKTEYSKEMKAIEKTIPYISKFVTSSSIKDGEGAVLEIAEIIKPWVVETFACDASEIPKKRNNIPEELQKLLEDLIERIQKGEANYDKNLGSKEEPKDDDIVVSILTDDMEEGDSEEGGRKPDYVIDLRKNPPKTEESDESEESGESGESTEGSSESSKDTSENASKSSENTSEGDLESDSESASMSAGNEEEAGEESQGESGESESESENASMDTSMESGSGSEKEGEDGEKQSASSKPESGEEKGSKASSDSSSEGDESDTSSNEDELEDSSEAEEVKETKPSKSESKTERPGDPNTRISNEKESSESTDGVDYSEDYIKDLVKKSFEKIDEDLFQRDITMEKAVERAEKAFDRIDEDKTCLSDSDLDDLANQGFPARGKGSIDFEEIYEDHSHLVETPSEIKTRGRQAQTKIKNLIKAKSRPNRQGCYDGMIDPSNLYKLTVGYGDIFMRNGSKVDPDMCCFVLKDNSGSMRGEKEEDAIEAVAEIEEIFKGIVPTKIATFDERGCEEHLVIKDWTENSPKSYTMTHHKHYEPRGGNYDAFAISIAAKELLKRPEKNKLLIVLSDGMPAGGQDDTLGHVRAAVEYARKQGIFVCSFFFGPEDFLEDYWANYKEMYRTHFAGCTSENLGKYLAKFVRTFIESKI